MARLSAFLRACSIACLAFRDNRAGSDVSQSTTCVSSRIMPNCPTLPTGALAKPRRVVALLLDIERVFFATLRHVDLEEWRRRFQNYLDSSDELVRDQGGSL